MSGDADLSAIGLDSSPLPGWIYDVRTFEVLAVNDAALVVARYSREELLGTSLLDLSPEPATPPWRRFRRRDDRLVEVEICATIRMAFASAEAQLELFIALVDPATQLPNLAALLRTPSSESTTLLLVRTAWSADAIRRERGFREAAARAAADVIEQVVPSGAMLARYSDDVFAIRLRGGRARPAAALSRKLLATFERPIVVEGGELSATPIIGMAGGGTDLAGQARDAEAALEHAAATGTSVGIFDDDLAAAYERRAVIERNLRHAILDARVTVVFQPIVALDTTDVVGAEALMRWDCPGLGPVSPPEFITIAEQSRAILRLGEWILREACAQNKRWQLAGLPPTRITVNVAPRQIAERDFVKLVNGVLEGTSLPAGALEIELTGTAAVGRDALSRRALEALRRLGVRVAIDDFGSSYSSIGDLGSVPADTLKLDRAFVQELGTNGFKTEAARAVIGLAHVQGLRVVGVGVENAAQVAALREMGCDEAQGFLLGAPTDAERFAARLERGRMRPAAAPSRPL